MLVAFVMTVAAQVGVFGLSADDRVTPRVAAKRVAKCDAGTVTVKSDSELDLDILVVTGSTPVSDRQLACIDEAAGYYEVALQPSVQPRFAKIRESRQTALAAAEARSWLKAHGLLDRLPDYKPGVTDDDAFARKVEILCRADKALHSRFGPNVLDPEWMERFTTAMFKDEPVEGDAMKCIFNVAAATGFEIGFIGNEQAGH